MGDAPSRRETQMGLGSGFIVNKAGIILTNNHVVAGADEVWVQLGDQRRFEARVVGSDPATDVAVVKLNRPPGDMRPAVLGNSEQVRVGDYVLAIGNPLGLGQTVTMGIVSAKNRMLVARSRSMKTSSRPTRPSTREIRAGRFSTSAARSLLSTPPS